MRPAAVLLVTLAFLPAAAADWPLFRGNALMTGVGQAKLPDQLQERWTFKCGRGVESAPAVVCTGPGRGPSSSSAAESRPSHDPRSACAGTCLKYTRTVSPGPA